MSQKSVEGIFSEKVLLLSKKTLLYFAILGHFYQYILNYLSNNAYKVDPFLAKWLIFQFSLFVGQLNLLKFYSQYCHPLKRICLLFLIQQFLYRFYFLNYFLLFSFQKVCQEFP